MKRRNFLQTAGMLVVGMMLPPIEMYEPDYFKRMVKEGQIRDTIRTCYCSDSYGMNWIEKSAGKLKREGGILYLALLSEDGEVRGWSNFDEVLDEYKIPRTPERFKHIEFL